MIVGKNNFYLNRYNSLKLKKIFINHDIRDKFKYFCASNQVFCFFFLRKKSLFFNRYVLEF